MSSEAAFTFDLSFWVEWASSPCHLHEPAAFNAVPDHAGVYYLIEWDGSASIPGPYSAKCIYIGMSYASVRSRAWKHRASLRSERNSKGNPTSSPGRRFTAYRNSRAAEHGGDANCANGIYLVYGKVSEAADQPFAIGCAEEALLWRYVESNGDLPACNSAQRRPTAKRRSPDAVRSQPSTTRQLLAGLDAAVELPPIFYWAPTLTRLALKHGRGNVLEIFPDGKVTSRVQLHADSPTCRVTKRGRDFVHRPTDDASRIRLVETAIETWPCRRGRS